MSANVAGAKHRHLLAIDQGTTGTTALVMSVGGETLGRATRELPQHFPQPGWVEHDALEIWTSVESAIDGALSAAGVQGTDIAAIGITNQRETTLLWERGTGQPVHRAIVWQDRRTSEHCQRLKAAGHEPRVRELTGLVLDPYFSGTKLSWLLEHVAGARARAERGELAFGTVDSYLVYRLAGGGPSAPHVTDVTNASRTLFMDLGSLSWSDAMCELLGAPRAVLPRIVPSSGVVARTRGVRGLPDGIPISGLAGDQHAALFGQGCLAVGDAKCTYGTGAFLLVNVGPRPVPSRFGLLATLGFQADGEVVYALEGSVFVAGAAVQWLRDGLGLIGAAKEIEALARSVPDSGGAQFVPALSGLGAPHWDADARGLICGITRGTSRGHLARATLDAIAYSVNDLVEAMQGDLGRRIERLRVDGGAAENDLLMELQAGISGITVERPRELESTARGAAMLAGLGAGIYSSANEAAKIVKLDRAFPATMSVEERASRRSAWHDAVGRARSQRA
jgi:glycerol kinase